MSERPCLYSKTKNIREKGCQEEAWWRVILGDGQKIDVCNTHVEGYKGIGLKIIKLRRGEENETKITG